MKKVLLFILLCGLFCFFGCKNKSSIEKKFIKLVNDSTSYKVNGIMETFYENGRKQNDFCVYYKNPDLIKVVLKSNENNDQQIILKNKDGVYVLIPSVNKSFKIQSSWPSNASYPYLLQSLVKDLVNEKSPIIIDNEEMYSIEVATKMHKDALAVKMKIIFDRNTCLPTEVLVYNEANDLYIRCVFQSIDLEFNINDEEFTVPTSIANCRSIYGEDGLVFNTRSLELPAYCPEGSILDSQSNLTNDRRIIKYTGTYGFTIIQELVNDSETTVTTEEHADAMWVCGTVAMLGNNYIKFIYEGIEYTIASSQMKIDEMVKISSSYMIETAK